MPTVLRIGPFRFFFYSNENAEPPHIHVQRDKALAKFWLEPVRYAGSKHFASKEIRELHKLVQFNQAMFLEAWYAHFSN